MSKDVNLAIPKKVVDAFIASMNSDKTPAEQALAARNVIDAMKKATAAAAKGYKRPELTVCNLKLGHVCPNDVERFLAGEIPRLTVYRSRKPTRNMSVHAQRPPKVYKERQQCTTKKKSIVNTTTGTRRRLAKPDA